VKDLGSWLKDMWFVVPVGRTELHFEERKLGPTVLFVGILAFRWMEVQNHLRSLGRLAGGNGWNSGGDYGQPLWQSLRTQPRLSSIFCWEVPKKMSACVSPATTVRK
jgi:hypothetical protein